MIHILRSPVIYGIASPDREARKMSIERFAWRAFRILLFVVLFVAGRATMGLTIVLAFALLLLLGLLRLSHGGRQTCAE